MHYARYMRRLLTEFLCHSIKLFLPQRVIKTVFNSFPSSRNLLVRYSRIVSGIIFWPLQICPGATVLEKEIYINSLFTCEKIESDLNSIGHLNNLGNLKIGLIGNLSGISMTPPSFLNFFAYSEHKLYIFDVSGQDLLSKKSKFHHAFSYWSGADKWKNLEQICDNINREELDLVVIADTMAFASCVASRISAKAIYYYSFGSGILPKIKGLTNILCQPQIDFELSKNCVYSYNSKSQLAAARTIAIPGYYDRKDIEINAVKNSTGDFNYIFYHGSTYKILNYSFLKSISRILSSQVDLKFVYVGEGTFSQLFRIKLYLLIFGISRRCIYIPHMQYSRGQFWSLGEILGKSLVYLNPWPVGGGAARFEAYACGVPVAHLELSKNHSPGKTKSRTVVDVQGFKTKLSKNMSKSDYVEFVIRVINDISFRKMVINEQSKKLEYLSSSTRWWNQVIEDYTNQVKS
jgi:hypothetical protein